MNSRRCCNWRRWARRTSPLGLLLVLALGVATPARAGAPDWLRAVAQAPLPSYPSDTVAVMLLNEQITTVKDSGEIETRYRRAYKILRPQGRGYATVSVYFDSETELTWLKGWGLPPGEKEYEVKEKDAVETTPYHGALYSDERMKVLRIPGGEPGNVVGYEYVQKGRPLILQDTWWVGKSIPVREARYTLELPSGWEFDAHWLHHDDTEPQAAGENRWVWTLDDVPAVEVEPAMPAWRAVAARLVVSLFANDAALRAKSQASWDDIGRWYGRLAAGRRTATPAMRAKVAELTAGATTPLEKIQALAQFVQQQVRYVAIEIGVGGYQPHTADQVFTNRYGDCKDKATLLSALLAEVGIQSDYVLINSSRGVVEPAVPVRSFNHAILAIELPPGTDTSSLPSVQDDPQRGRLLFFDPTSTLTPLGYLPPSLQANYGLLVTPTGGELVELPLPPPQANRLQRVGHLVLGPTGQLSGSVEETRSGWFASSRRGTLLEAPVAERPQVVERFLSSFLPGFHLNGTKVEHLEDSEVPLVLHYEFVAERYAKRAGNLLLLRPRVLGRKSSSLLEEKERKYPVTFRTTSQESDEMDIVLPMGYAVDELPPPVEVKTDFADYSSQVEVKGQVLHYQRRLILKQVLVPVERLGELKEFYRQVAADERNQAVLKHQ